MDDQPISDQVRRFIADHISSVAQLEILLLLQTNPQQSWTPADVARELRVEPSGAASQLSALVNSGLLVQEPDRFRYAPRTPELHAASVALAQAYLIRRVTVIGLIFANPHEKIRGFSDAFRIRKEPPDAR